MIAAVGLLSACSPSNTPTSVAEIAMPDVVAQLVDEITVKPAEPLPEWVIGPFGRGITGGTPMAFRKDLTWSDPTAGAVWRPRAVWNPSLIEVDARLYMFYRAGPTLEGLNSRIALAWSDDGGATWTDYEENPIIYPTESYESRSVEDPVVFKHDDSYYLFYQAVEDMPDGGVYADIALATSSDLLNWRKRGRVIPRSVTGGWAKGPAIVRSPSAEAVQIDGEFLMYLSELPMVGETDAEEQMIGRSTDLLNWSFEQTAYLDPEEIPDVQSIYQVATALTDVPGSDRMVLDFFYAEPDGGYGCAQALYSMEDPTRHLAFNDYGVCTWGGIIAFQGAWLMAHGWEEPAAMHLYTAPLR